MPGAVVDLGSALSRYIDHVLTGDRATALRDFKNTTRTNTDADGKKDLNTALMKFLKLNSPF